MVALVTSAPADEARFPGPKHGGSGPGLSSPARWRDSDATANLSPLLHLSGVWNSFSPGSQPLQSQDGRPALGGSAVNDPARVAEVLLWCRQLPEEDLYRGSTRHGGALRAAELPVERSSEMADACLSGRAGARLGRRLGLLASRSTLLREVHHRAAAASV